MLDFVLFLVAVILFGYFIAPLFIGIVLGLFGKVPERAKLPRIEHKMTDEEIIKNMTDAELAEALERLDKFLLWQKQEEERQKK